MFTNNGSGPAAVTPTTAQLQTLKTQVLAVTAAGQPAAGYTDQQIADYLNLPATIPNPKPNTLPPAGNQLTPAQFQSICLKMRTIVAGNATLLASLNSLTTILATGDAVNLGDPNVQTALTGFVQSVQAAGLITAGQATRALYTLDGGWQPNLDGQSRSWAYVNLGGAWLEASDVTTAKAS